MKTPVSIELKVSTTPESSRLGQVVQAMAKEAGFAVTLRPTEYATMLEETDSGHYDAFTSGWSGRLDPDGNIASFLQTRGAMNAYGLSDPAIDRLVERGRAEADPDERAKIYDELTRHAQKRRGLIYLYRQKNYIVTGKDVAGVRVYGDGLVRVTAAGTPDDVLSAHPRPPVPHHARPRQHGRLRGHPGAARRPGARPRR